MVVGSCRSPIGAINRQAELAVKSTAARANRGCNDHNGLVEARPGGGWQCPGTKVGREEPTLIGRSQHSPDLHQRLGKGVILNPMEFLGISKNILGFLKAFLRNSWEI